MTIKDNFFFFYLPTFLEYAPVDFAIVQNRKRKPNADFKKGALKLGIFT